MVYRNNMLHLKTENDDQILIRDKIHQQRN